MRAVRFTLALLLLFVICLSRVLAADELGMAYALLEKEEDEGEETTGVEMVVKDGYIPERRTSLRVPVASAEEQSSWDELFRHEGDHSRRAHAPHSRPPHSHPPHSRPPHSHPPHSRPPHSHPPHSHHPHHHPPHPHRSQITEDIDETQEDELLLEMLGNVPFEDLFKELTLGLDMLRDATLGTELFQKEKEKACWKDNEPRGAGVAPDRESRSCPDSKPEKSMGLCYPKCGPKRTGLGPLCLDDCKAMKYTSDGVFFCCESPEVCEKLIRTMTVRLPRTLAQFLSDVVTNPENVKKIMNDVRELLAIARELRLPVCSKLGGEISDEDYGKDQHLSFENDLAVEM